MSYTTYLRTIKNELQRTGRTKKSLRVKTIMEQFGYQRRSQAFVDNFNHALDDLELNTEPIFDLNTPLDTKLAISIKGVTPESKSADSAAILAKLSDTIPVKHDFFYYLFDFVSEQEYERFQVCLDSNQPVGIFLIPQKEDFFSDIVVKILNYELIRKYQYKGSGFIPKASNQKFTTNITADDSDNEKEYSLSDANIYHFYLSTMTSVILGNTALDLLDCEKFDEQFEQISLYANKYNSEQFFIVFHCPSASDIQAQQQEDALGYLVDRVASKIPFTFTLRCKYPNEAAIKYKEEIYAHFRLLLELPYYQMEEDEASLLNYFLELQKAQIFAESQLLLRMKAEHFYTLKWQQESTEYIYLKYFAIKTLENLGYELSQIRCEVELTSRDQETTDDEMSDYEEEYQSEIIQVYVENKVIVEIETLKYQEFQDNNLFLDSIKRIVQKSKVWPNQLETVWLVVPGFEIARNYYQIKKAKEVLKFKLTGYYSDNFQIVVMAPDYENHQLVPVSFDSINYPSFEYGVKKQSVGQTYSLTNRAPEIKLDFSQVKGLKEEKEKLSKLLKLQSKGYQDAISGILFYGLPGCGKTLLANAFANESARYFFKFSPADIISVWIGQSQKNIRDIFAQAKKKSPSVLFIDELDSIGFNRNEDNAHTDQKATINQLLIELNNLRNSNVIVIAATNYLSGIDSALKRSGRLDWKIPIFPPDKSERIEIFQHYLAKIDFEQIINFEFLAEKSVRFTSSDIELVCREVRNAILLEEISSSLTTADIITYIHNLQEGGLTLNEEQVKGFLDECHSLSVKNPKLETLKLEWGLD
ncbi:ATP-binding protein [Calothrix sp. FACHB-1219]|uniref:ATP-binding protein n=1 Tax=unclassified Calothrix TaxID=2619626 RepID=UPI0016888AB1|nr:MULTISPECIES: ATP-binding protein [unclassified Calothrix]MBD2203005.1 ATP-binding protein [Calothrix sp. FACHB-168]MBD2216133.1 ATP-binding protein [Calothrix sp. FACHB-1219]